MKIEPFGKNIEPSCKYCEFVQSKGDELMCRLKPNKIIEEPCRKYRYDPLKRIPEKPKALPEYNPDDFIL